MTRLSVGAVLRTAVAAALAAQLFCCTREPPPRADADVIVATVDLDRITLKDLKNEIAARRGLSPTLPARSASPEEVREALRLLIERTVVLAEGKRLGVVVAGSEVEREIERYRSDFPPGGLEKAILQAGTDVETWREGLSRSLLYRKAARAIADARATVSDKEVEAVFRKRAKELSRPERLRVRQFLFDSDEAARKARRRIVDGESPEEVVRQFSEGDSRPTTADLGYVSREDLPKELAAELFALDEGDVSDVAVREQTYSLFQVVRKSPAGTLSLPAAAPEIREELLRARREEAFRSWLSDRVGKAGIRVQEALLSKVTEGKQ